MKLREIYEQAVRLGIEADVRRSGINGYWNKTKKNIKT